MKTRFLWSLGMLGIIAAIALITRSYMRDGASLEMIPIATAQRGTGDRNALLRRRGHDGSAAGAARGGRGVSQGGFEGQIAELSSGRAGARGKVVGS